MNAVARVVALRQLTAPSQGFLRAYVASAQPQPLEEDDSASQPAPQPASHSNEQPFVPLNFDDPRIAFRTKTTGELLLAHGVFTACQVRTQWHVYNVHLHI